MKQFQSPSSYVLQCLDENGLTTLIKTHTTTFFLEIDNLKNVVNTLEKVETFLE